MADAIIALISLIALEVILGIDNIIFISILSDKLPENQRNKLRFWGIVVRVVSTVTGRINSVSGFQVVVFSVVGKNKLG